MQHVPHTQFDVSLSHIYRVDVLAEQQMVIMPLSIICPTFSPPPPVQPFPTNTHQSHTALAPPPLLPQVEVLRAEGLVKKGVLRTLDPRVELWTQTGMKVGGQGARGLVQGSCEHKQA